MYEIIVILKGITEVAGVALFGQGVLWLLAGAGRDKNLVYGIFKVITGPVIKLTRLVTPRIIVDQHIGMVAFFWVALLWLALTVLKIRLVLEQAGATAP